MNHTLFLKIALPAIAIPALVVFLLPAGVWPTYIDVAEPLALFAGSLLALQVSFTYRKQLKSAFVFLSAFLFIYAVVIILLLSFSPLLLPYFEARLDDAELFRVVQSVQFINYAMLLLFCVNLLKVINIKELNRNGWILFGLASVFSVFVAIYPVFDSLKNISVLGLPGLFSITIRILDAALIIVLAPVLWLYIQHLKSQERQSLTFTIIIFGIVSVTLFDYLFQSIIQAFPGLISESSPFLTTIPEAIFIYGYLIIAAGLYAHRKQDEWGFKTVDRIMAGELTLVADE